MVLSESGGGPPKSNQPPAETFQTSNHSVDVSKSTSTVTIRQQSSAIAGPRAQSMFSETGSKVSELSSRFSCADKSKPAPVSASPPKPGDHSKSVNSTADQSNEDYVQVSKKEFIELKSKVIARLLKVII